MNKITKNGHEFFITDQNWGNFWRCLEDGIWEPYTFDIMDRFLSSDENCFDVGAWIGPTALYASRLCKRCFAFEPDPIAYVNLCDNIAANKIGNIDTFQRAILNYDGSIALGSSNSLGDSGTSVKYVKHQFISQCSRLGSMVKELNLNSVKFIKIDVEGAEEFIFQDIDFFKEYKPTVYFSFHKSLVKDVDKALQDINRIGRMYKNRYDSYLNRVNILNGSGVITDL